MQDQEQMVKQAVVQANDCSELCQTMAQMMAEVTVDSFQGMTEDDMLTFSADVATANACLSRCQSMLMRR